MSDPLNHEQRILELEKFAAAMPSFVQSLNESTIANTTAHLAAATRLQNLEEENGVLVKMILSIPSFGTEELRKELSRIVMLRENRLDQSAAALAAIKSKLPPPPPPPG